MYSHMDALLAAGAALTRGATVSGVHECPDCGAWHMGQRKKIYPVCQATGKRMFTGKKAKQLVRYAIQKNAAGDDGRRETAAYQCKKKHGCGQWHVTSMDQEGFE